MSGMLRVVYVANAGILFQYDGVTILIDGLYGDEPHAFSNPPVRTREKLMRGEPPLLGADFILATHMHPDHASAALIQKYLEKNAVRGLFLPKAVYYPERKLEQYIEEQKIPYFPLTSRNGKLTCRLTENISVRIFPTLHSGREFRDVPHYCYILKFDDKECLVTGDVDYTSETFGEYADHTFRCIFVNPLFLHAIHDPAHFHGHLRYEDLCVYHIPFKSDDRFGIRKMAERDLRRWPEGERTPAALMESLQVLEL